MGNKASILVSQLISGTRFKTFVMGGKAYTMKSPCIKVLCRVIGEFAKADVDLMDFGKETLSQSAEAIRHIVKGLAYAVVGNVADYEQKATATAEEMENGSVEDVTLAMGMFIEMTSLTEVFQLAASATKYAQAAATQK